MKYSLIATLGIVLALTACRKDAEKAFLFEMEYPVDFTINAGLGPYLAHYFEIPNIPTYYDSLLAYHNMEDADVTLIQARKARLISIFNDVNYDFIKSIDVEIYDTQTGTTKYFPAFYRDPVPENTGSTVELIAEETDLTPYLKSDRFNVRIRLELFSAAPQTIESRLILSFAAR